MTREGLTEQMTFQSRPEGSKGANMLLCRGRTLEKETASAKALRQDVSLREGGKKSRS